MHSVRYFLVAALSLCAAVAFGQRPTDVLFTVDGQDVTVGEFKYIYDKTNGDEATYDEQSVREYLDLYERFKLKVARARAMGLDTVAALQRELAGYRRQLADNYLIDKQVTDRLVAELYERQQSDIEFSHILVQMRANPNPTDTARLYAKATELRRDLTPSNFAEVARVNSDDKFSAPRGGYIGYITAPFPKGMHQLEDALYDAPLNTVVGPVRTALGYHLAIKTARRPARGQIELAQIMVRKPTGTTKMPTPAQLEGARKMLANGQDFKTVAARVSEDKSTKDNGGYLGFVGINKYEQSFEDAAFALTEDGQVSDIVESKIGFHLLKRISKKPVQPLADVRPLLENQVKADGRFAAAQKKMIQDIRRQGNVREDKAVFGRYAAGLVDSTFLDFRWKPDGSTPATPILTFGDGSSVGLPQLEEYLRKNSRQRVSLGRRNNAATVAGMLYDDWVEQELVAYAESKLEDNYPEFAALMREYREGILLFEATKMEVWDKASADTSGLRAFFAANRDDYRWPERARVTRYEIKTDQGLDVTAIQQFARRNGEDATLNEFGREFINTRSTDYDRERVLEETKAEGLRTEAGSVSKIVSNRAKNTAVFYKVETLLPATRKELDEARGYVIADYQDELEDRWVDQLRKTYPVKRNKKVLAKIIN